MNISTDNNRKIGKTLAVGFPLATLLVMALSADPAGAAVTSAKAFSWGNNSYGQLGNGTYGPATATNTPGAVKQPLGCQERQGRLLPQPRALRGRHALGLGIQRLGPARQWHLRGRNRQRRAGGCQEPHGGHEHGRGGYEFTVAVTQ